MKAKVKKFLGITYKIGKFILLIVISYYVLKGVFWILLGSIACTILGGVCYYVYKIINDYFDYKKKKRKIMEDYVRKNENLKQYALELVEGLQVCKTLDGEIVCAEEFIPYCEEQFERFRPPYLGEESKEQKILKDYEEKERLVTTTTNKEKLTKYKQELIDISFQLQTLSFQKNPFLNSYSSIGDIYEQKEEMVIN